MNSLDYLTSKSRELPLVMSAILSFCSQRQAQAFRFVLNHFEENGIVPTEEQLASELKTARGAVPHKMYKRMVDCGLLKRIELPTGRKVLVPVGVKVRNEKKRKR